jgi:predicted Zn-dependent peptidase
MNYHKHLLKNGLRVITTPMPSLESVTVTVWVKTGSRQEDLNVNGISHFLEHMVFKGSSKRKTSKEIAEAVDKIGGEFNAATSKEWTNFYIKARKDNLEMAMDVLSDMVLNPLLKETDIEREKGVIVEEIAMYEDMPMLRVGDVFEETMFSGHKLGWDIAGSEKTVRSITKKDFLKYRGLHYDAQNIILTVAGGVDEKKVKALASKYFSGLKKESSNKTKNEFVYSQTKPLITVKNKKNEQAHLVLGFLGGKRGSKDRFVRALLSNILGGGMSSRLFTEIREKRGLAYSVRTSTESFMDTGYLATYAGVDPGKAQEAVKVALDQHYGLAKGKYKIDSQELLKAKEYLKGHMALGLEDTREVNDFVGEQELFLGKIESPAEIFEAIDKVTAKQIVDLAKEYFVPERMSFAVIGPFADQSVFTKILK